MYAGSGSERLTSPEAMSNMLRCMEIKHLITYYKKKYHSSDPRDIGIKTALNLPRRIIYDFRCWVAFLNYEEDAYKGVREPGKSFRDCILEGKDVYSWTIGTDGEWEEVRLDPKEVVISHEEFHRWLEENHYTSLQ